MYNEKNEVKIELDQKNSKDDFSELKFFEDNPDYFKIFEDSEFQSTIKIENKNEIIEKGKDDNDDIDDINNNNENESDSFIIETRKKIYENYLNNYIKANYKFKNEIFSLSSDFSRKIFFQIKNVDIFEINYLKIISINKNTKEWVCNSYYGLYLLHKIKKCKKPYPIYPEKDKDIEIKSISNEGDFDQMISRGINEFEDLNYEINLDKIYKEYQPFFNFQILKGSNKLNKFLNLSENIVKKGKYDFLNKLFQQKYLYDKFIYIFQSKNFLNTENILENLISIHDKEIGKFLYLDMDYINKIKSRNDLKKYLAFWLIRAFHKADFANYKSFYEKIAKNINFGKIDYIIKSLIEYNRSNYQGEKIFIILNNVNGEKNYRIIEDIKNSTQNEGSHHSFIIFSNIEDQYNFQQFFDIYKTEGIKLILLPNLIFNEPINNESIEIHKLFSEYSPEKFTDLIKIFHFTSFMNYNSGKTQKDFSELDIIEKYIKFFTLYVENNLEESKPIIKDIKFKNKDIEEKFLLQYEDYFVSAIDSDESLKAVLNLNDGDFFEKLIILDIITGKINKNNNINDNFVKLEVNSLFGLEINELDWNKYKGKNIIFTQKNKTAEIFDVGILYNKDNTLIMKLYQISIRKSKDDLAKLDEDIIKLHCINISKNLEKLGKIKKFSFGIITSYNCYDKNKDNYKLMKTHCKNNNFELLIYNIIKKQFFIEKEGDENVVLPLENVYSINDKNNLVLPNYDSFFQIKPRLITMKYLNRNYINCFKKYFNEDEKCDDIKIIGKIDYNKSLINSKFNDENLGLLISGYIPGEKYDKEKEEDLSLIEFNTEYRIIKENGKNIIYEKKPKAKYTIENDEFEKILTNPHAILFKYDKKKYLNKKRNPEELFSKIILSMKK